MLLSAATISGFKSFRKPVEILFSERTSVLIGPNDHGKTNVLLAVERLAPDKQFAREDVNDRTNEDAAHITYQFSLTDAELTAIDSGIRPLLEQELNGIAEHLTAPRTQTMGELAALTESPIQRWVKNIQNTRKIEFVRHVGRSLELCAPALVENARVALFSVLSPLVPKVLLFSAGILRQLPDTVTLSALESNEVMQGVFRLAGIWDLRSELLSGNPRGFGGPNNPDDSKKLDSRERYSLSTLVNDIRLTTPSVTILFTRTNRAEHRK